MTRLTDRAGLCPNCDQAGFVGEPCSERGCQKRGYHAVPTEYVRGSAGALDAMVGCCVSDYLIVDVLGEGGFGKVYLCLQLPIMMRAAIKLVRAQFVDPGVLEVLLEKFRAEAEALGSLSHPNIVRLFKYGVHDGSPYMVMELVDHAKTLKQETGERARRGQRFAPSESHHILRQVADGLDAAHAHRIVHRDVKPENIMLQSVQGHEHLVRLLDFGLAKFVEEQTENSMAIGTPYYMAPEQLARRGVGPWTDVYAIGVIAFQLFTGRRPFHGLDSRAVVAQKMNPSYDPAWVLRDLAYPEPVLAFFRGALAVSPSERFRSAQDFRRALDAAFPAIAAEEATSPRPIDLSQIVDLNELVGDAASAETPARVEPTLAPAPGPAPPAADIDPIGKTIIDDRPSEPIRVRAARLAAREQMAPEPPPDPPPPPPARVYAQTRRDAVRRGERDLAPTTEHATEGYELASAAPRRGRRTRAAVPDERAPRVSAELQRQLMIAAGLLAVVLIGVFVGTGRGGDGAGTAPVAVETDADRPTPGVTAEAPRPAISEGPLGMRWVTLDGGAFGMGSSGGDPDEQPIHRVNVRSFEMNHSEVTVAQYRMCIERGGCTPPVAFSSSGWRHTCAWGRADSDHTPVNCVTWDQAAAACEWLDARLPTEAEWEYAARGGRIQGFPWGDDPATCELAVMKDAAGTGGCGDSRPLAVCSRPRGSTRHGLCDMAGNVAEWVDAWYAVDAYAQGGAGAAAVKERVVRGGSFAQGAHEMRVSDRTGIAPSLAVGAIGFRCARRR